MNRATLLLAAHGSPDPRAAPVALELADGVRRRLPCVAVSLGFLGHAEPSVEGELNRLLAGPGRGVTVVPLLLAPGFHTDVDLPAIVTGAKAAAPMAEVRVTAPFGAHGAVVSAALGRLVAAGVPAGAAVTVVLAATGSTNPAADAVVTETATALSAAGGWPVQPATADTIPEVVAAARAAGETVAVAPMVLAPGVFADRISAAARAAGAEFVAAPLGAHPALIRLAVERYAAVLAPEAAA